MHIIIGSAPSDSAALAAGWHAMACVAVPGSWGNRRKRVLLPDEQQAPVQTQRKRPAGLRQFNPELEWQAKKARTRARIDADVQKQEEKLKRTRLEQRIRDISAVAWQHGTYMGPEIVEVWRTQNLGAVPKRTAQQNKAGFDAATAAVDKTLEEEPDSHAELRALPPTVRRKAITRAAKTYGQRMMLGQGTRDKPHPAGERYEARKPFLK